MADNKVRAVVISYDEEDVSKEAESRGVATEKEWDEVDSTSVCRIIRPPFNLFSLTLFPEKNSELGQCIEAMATNVCGFGFKLWDPLGRDVEELPAPVEKEWEELDEFLTYGDWSNQSHMAVRRLIRWDLEATGNSWLELIENRSEDIIGYNHIPAYQMRLTALDAEDTVYRDYRAVGRGKNRRIIEVMRKRRFRRYVQLTKSGDNRNVVYFKELGDPRPISRATGKPLTREEVAAKVPQANPMLHFRLGRSRTPYGLPRYVGNIMAIIGGRSSESINFNTIRNNNIPSMVVSVSNGQLTDGTIERIKEFTKGIRDSENYSRFLIIEADPDAKEAAGGQVKIEVQPLGQLQKEDAMFQQYEKGNQSKVRRAFRLPEVMVGMAGDYTANNVESSRRIADEQVFGPERAEEDWHWNRILRYNGAKHHIYRSNGPNVTDDEDVIKVMSAAERSGAMTPRRATAMLEDVMGMRLPPLSADIDPDTPFSMQMAEAVKNTAPVGVGTQVTALKSLSLKSLHQMAVAALKQSATTLPGVRLDAEDVQKLLSGETDSILLDQDVFVDGRAFVLLDGYQAVGIMKLLNPQDEGGKYRYAVQDLLPLAGKPVACEGGNGYVDAVMVG